STRIGGIGVVDGAILEHKRTDARRIACVRGHVCSRCGRVVDDTLRRCPVPRPVRTVVVFGDPLELLLLGYRDVEIEVEVAADRCLSMIQMIVLRTFRKRDISLNGPMHLYLRPPIIMVSL